MLNLVALACVSGLSYASHTVGFTPPTSLTRAGMSYYNSPGLHVQHMGASHGITVSVPAGHPQLLTHRVRLPPAFATLCRGSLLPLDTVFPRAGHRVLVLKLLTPRWGGSSSFVEIARCEM